MDKVQVHVTQANEQRICDLLVKHGFTIYRGTCDGIPYDLPHGRQWPFICITISEKHVGGNSTLKTTNFAIIKEQQLIELLEPTKRKHQEATFTDWNDIQPKKEKIQRVLTETAQEQRDAFVAHYGLGGNCSCHINPPCGSCTHEGNPRNQEEDESAWEIPEPPKEAPMPQNEKQDVMNYTTIHSTLDNLVPRDYTVQEVFGFPSQIKIAGYEPGHPFVPVMEHKYVWDAGLAKDMIEWLSEDSPDPLWLSGESGCGKTCALKAVFSALNIPTVVVSAKSSTEPDDILGRTQLRGGDTVFVPGDLLKAYERGYAIIFDEIDGYNPEVGMAIHRLLERETIVLDDGTVIKPAKRNLIAATANTRGDGHGGDIYAATKAFNLATMNRFEKWNMNYPPASVEESILRNAFGASLDDTLVVSMVKTAEDIRRAYRDGSCPGPISVRDMLRWGRKLKQSWNRKDVAPIYHSFDKAFGNGTELHVRQMLHTLIQSRFGVAAPQISGLV